MTVQEFFSMRLKEYRLRAGLDLTELSKKAGVSYGVIHRYENSTNLKQIDMLTVRKIARALGRTVEDFCATNDDELNKSPRVPALAST